MTSVIGRTHTCDLAVDARDGAPDVGAPPPERGDPRGERPGRRRRSRRHRRFRRLKIIAFVLLVALVPVGWSYGGYLTAPGNEPVSVRSVDWLRDHGFESAVNDVEGWYYTRDKPTRSKPAKSDEPSMAASAGAPAPSSSAPAFPGGGRWRDVTGLAVPSSDIQQSFVTPDPRYPSVAVALVRIDQQHLRTVYVPGLREPGGSFAWGGGVPAAHRPKLIAAFNAGFKMRNITGGVYTEGRHLVRPLKNGQASLVIYRDGHAEVAQWGRDATMSPDVVSVRQNLALIVDGSKPVSDLVSDRSHKWGTFNSQMQYTWRSGVGIDALGRLIYASGPQMSITELASALVDAGAVRAMQLDIHDGVVTFNWFRRRHGHTVGSRLTASMTRPADRFLAPDWRDFFALEAK